MSGSLQFTEKASKAIALAHEETKRLGYNFTGSEQLLLGIIGEGTSFAAKELACYGVTLVQARLAVQRLTGTGRGLWSEQATFTPGGKSDLQVAEDLARRLGYSQVRTEHLLLALINEGGPAVTVLRWLGVSICALKDSLFIRLKENKQ